MLVQLLSKKRVFIPLVLVLVFVASSLLYLHSVKRQATLDLKRTQAIVNRPKPPPPGETAESGHWHADEWHAEPHSPDTPHTSPPSAVAETQTPPPHQRREPPAWASWDFQAAYQRLREQYPDQTQNPPPFENVPVNLWDFQATKTAFMDNFNFYVEHYDPKEEWSHTRELRIASAVMMNIHNAAEPTFGLFTPEQCEEIKVLYRDLRKFEGYIPRIDKIMAEKGVTREVATRISIYERLKSKGWSDEEIPAHYREVGK